MGAGSKKIIITGGSGFIGQHLAKKFIDAKQHVSIFDIAEPSMKELKKAHVFGDVFNTEELEKALKAHDVIIHLVGQPDGAAAQKDPDTSFKLNVASLHNVLEACRKNGEKKIIFPSSAVVYGTAEDLPIKESTPLNPTWIYGWHKYLCEKLIKGYHDNYGINYVILRLFNVYGAGHRGVIEAFLEKARNGKTIESFGPYQYRDFVYAGDVAEAMYNAAMHYKVDNRIVNIGTGRGTQIKGLLELICEIFPNAKWVETKTKFTVYDSIADITLAKTLLDFKPHDTLEFMKKVIEREMM